MNSSVWVPRVVAGFALLVALVGLLIHRPTGGALILLLMVAVGAHQWRKRR